MYYKHVNLAFAMSVWKGQGSTFLFLLALLEMSRVERRLTFKIIYVMFSRDQESDKFRCLPLSKDFDKRFWYLLRPSIEAMRWRMDIGEDGLWRPNVLGKVKTSDKRFVSNLTFPVITSKNKANFERKPQIPKQSPLDGIKRKRTSKTSNCFIDEAPKRICCTFLIQRKVYWCSNK